MNTFEQKNSETPLEIIVDEKNNFAFLPMFIEAYGKDGAIEELQNKTAEERESLKLNIDRIAQVGDMELLAAAEVYNETFDELDWDTVQYDDIFALYSNIEDAFEKVKKNLEL